MTKSTSLKRSLTKSAAGRVDLCVWHARRGVRAGPVCFCTHGSIQPVGVDNCRIFHPFTRTSGSLPFKEKSFRTLGVRKHTYGRPVPVTAVETKVPSEKFTAPQHKHARATHTRKRQARAQLWHTTNIDLQHVSQ